MSPCTATQALFLLPLIPPCNIIVQHIFYILGFNIVLMNGCNKGECFGRKNCHLKKPKATRNNFWATMRQDLESYMQNVPCLPLSLRKILCMHPMWQSRAQSCYMRSTYNHNRNLQLTTTNGACPTAITVVMEKGERATAIKTMILVVGCLVRAFVVQQL